MIKIEITDPHLLEKKILEKTAQFLLELAGGRMVYVPDEQKAPAIPIPPPIPMPLVTPAIDTPVSDVLKQTEDLNGLVADEIAEQALVPPPFNPFAPKVIDPTAVEDTFDTRGFPWDNRIHARTKNKTHEGAWKYQRGLNSKVIDKIESELMSSGRCKDKLYVQTQGRVDRTPIPVPPDVPAVFQEAPRHIHVDPPVTADEIVTFQSVMQKITEAMVAGKLTREGVHDMLKRYGIPALPVLASRPDAIPAINEQLKTLLK